MQKWIWAAALILCTTLPAAGQESSRFEVSAGYTLVHSNAPPGGCGCFLMNGASAGAAFNLSSRFGAVADITFVYNGNVDSSGQSLLLTSYMFGPRYTWRNESRFSPFGEVMFGGAHASGLGYSGATGPASAFAAAGGGGVDLKINPRVALRLVEADYYFTHFQNAINSRESNIRLTFGFVFRFGKS